MKKVLFATTALVATAGVASAEVGFSAYAEMGVVGGDGGYAAGETQFFQDFHVNFSASTETNNGLTFGFTGQFEESNGVGRTNGGATLDSETVYISGDFGTLTLGDTDGAFDWAMQEIAAGTTIADDHTSHAGFNFNTGLDGQYDDQVLRYDNTFGDLAVAISLEMEDTGAVSGADDIFGVGVKYNAALGGVDLGLGLAFQTGSLYSAAVAASAGPDGLDGTADDVAPVAASIASADLWGISVDAKFDNGFRMIANYSSLDVTGGDVDHMGLGVSYATGDWLVEANYGEYDVSGGADMDGFGLGVNYNMGGGVTAMFGYGDSTWGSNNSDERWSLGVGMSF